MGKNLKIGYIILIFILSVFTGGNFFIKMNILIGLEELIYINGTLEYYETRPSPIEDSLKIKKMLHIKLNNSDKIYKNGLFLLAALDKNKFVSLADNDPKISLGIIRNDETNFYYDIIINQVSLVNKSKIINRLKMDQFGSILGCIIFLLYGIYELKRFRQP
ncbi:MAG: hypothetical protein KFKLKKLM_01206 [Flavobacteriales bacterium]|nr:hypothetical protein [Flavobacteriales bacterium]